MTQPPANNITTLFIADPNGGQPQMIKVMGGAKIPIQLANVSAGSSVSTSTIKNFIKTTANSQNNTIIPAGKIQNRQILALPTKQNINIQNIRGPVMVPVSNVQLKPNIPVVNSIRGSSNVISSPMVIRTQTGALAVATTSSATSTQNHIQLPSINVNKQATANATPSNLQGLNNIGGAPLKAAPFTIKSTQMQQQATANKPSEIIFVQQQKLNQNSSQQKSTNALLSQGPQAKPLQQLQHHQQISQGQSINSTKSFMNTSILDHSGNRKRHDFDFEYGIESKRRRPDKGFGKGLRHFSMKVCEKVKAKGTTTYNEVADELVSDFTETSRSHSPTDGVNYDQKNIRRRVYDALNVLMAMNIISKEKKEIRWIGLPTNSLQECVKLEHERKKRLQQIKKKTQQLQDLILQQIAFKNLVERNKKLEKENGPPAPNSAIQLPFIIVNTSKKTVIDCSISNDKTEYLFNFDDTFEIHDDIEVLKRMGMALGLDKGTCSASDLEKAKSLVPKNLESYVVDLAEGRSLLTDDEAMKIDETITTDGFDGSLNSVNDGNFMSGIGANVEMVLNDGVIKEEECSSLSRHSSLLSLHGGQRTDSCSPSSFGDDYDVDIEESDVEIS